MSRIGNQPITISEGVSIDISDNNLVTVKGPKGSLEQQVDTDLILEKENGELVVKRPTDQKRHKAMHGLYRSLINNMVEGVTTGYKKELELVGVGYKAAVQGKLLELNLGHSHSIFVEMPEEISVAAETVKGKNPIVTLEGIDKQLLGHVVAKIRSLRKIEPYKGKGVRFVGEQIRRKEGKKSAK
jgi:large subunit ribosomal protein L6